MDNKMYLLVKIFSPKNPFLKMECVLNQTMP
jgi:hypothetical protein